MYIGGFPIGLKKGVEEWKEKRDRERERESPLLSRGTSPFLFPLCSLPLKYSFVL